MDPREQLITAGNKLLNAVYEYETFKDKYGEWRDRIIKNPLDPDIFTDMEVAGVDKAEFILGSLRTTDARAQALTEYVILRRTIEAMEEAK